MGVLIANAMRSVFPKRGSRISKATTAACVRIEMTSERRRRLRSSESPSTRHPPREPRASFGIVSETFRESCGIAHPQIFFGEASRIAGTQGPRKFCDADLLGLL